MTRWHEATLLRRQWPKHPTAGFTAAHFNNMRESPQGRAGDAQQQVRVRIGGEVVCMKKFGGGRLFTWRNMFLAMFYDVLT